MVVVSGGSLSGTRMPASIGRHVVTQLDPDHSQLSPSARGGAYIQSHTGQTSGCYVHPEKMLLPATFSSRFTDFRSNLSHIDHNKGHRAWVPS
jgi:hypothetical protein